MNPFRPLRSWPGRPRPSRARIAFEILEDRLAPAASKVLAAPIDHANFLSTNDLIARTTSTHAQQDLANVVNAYGLQSKFDLHRSEVLFTAEGSTLLHVGLAPSGDVPNNADVDGLMQVLQKTGLYSSVSPNYVYAGADYRERTPNDPLFGDQFYQTIISAPAAWDKTYGSATVTVALLDDGVDITHPDLKDNVWTNAAETPGDGLDNDGNGFIDDVHGWDFVSNTNNVLPDDPSLDPHGTEVAGTLAGRIDNAAGVAGIAGGARFLPLKVVGNGPTTSLTLARAAIYAVQNGAKIINNSLNIDQFVGDPTFEAAVTFARQRGVLWINSAGNLNLKDPPRQAFESMILVAATDRNDVKTSYSNYGTGIDLTAPGGTESEGFSTTKPGGTYGNAFGTSMAAPLVAGTAALIWSAYPSYTRDQVASAILATADSIDAKNPNFIDLLGDGRLNAGAALSGSPVVTHFGTLGGLPPANQPAPPTLGSFTLRLASNLDPATVVGSNFELRFAGADNTFDTADDSTLPMTINDGRAYEYGSNSLAFGVNQALSRGLYRFTAKSGGLNDPFGTAVDGDGNGVAGGNLVRYFGVAAQIGGSIYIDTQDDGFPGESDPPLSGQPVFGDVNNNGQFDQFGFPTSDGPQTIPDLGGASADVPVSGFASTLGHVRVNVLVSHAQPGDLVITIISPDGTRVTLLRNRVLPGAGIDQHAFTFEDDAVESTVESPTQITHILTPEDSLDCLIGSNPNGIWRIEVIDTTAGDTGTLLSASMTISTEQITRTDASGQFSFDQLPLQPVTIRVLEDDGWKRAGGSGGVIVDLSRPTKTDDIRIGVVPASGIAGRVFQDNGDNAFSSTDRGAAGITLFDDANGSGILDSGEATTVTDAGGNFNFRNLALGSHTIRLVAKPGYGVLAPSGGSRTVTLTSADTLASGTDFLLGRATGPVAISIAPIATPKSGPTSEIDFSLGEPLPGFSIGNLALMRSGATIDLTSATLINSDTSYKLIGLAPLTGAEGIYSLTITGPAPADDPTRAPTPTTVGWTVDTTGPTVSLTPTPQPQSNGVIDSVTVHFSKPVTGLDLADFVLRFQGQVVPLTNVRLTGVGSSSDYLLTNLRSAALRAGDYSLTLAARGSGIGDAAGNLLLDDAAAFWSVRLVRRIALGAGEGSSPSVYVYDANNTVLTALNPYDRSLTGGTRVTTGDVNGDGVEDIIVAPGRGGGPRVKVYDGQTFQVIRDFFAFEPTFLGGVFIAVGDLNADGVPDIIATPDRGGGPRVRVFDGVTTAVIADFFGIQDVNFRGGARATVGDFNHDGTPDLVVSAGTGGGPRVAIFDGSTVRTQAPQKLCADFFAFESSLRNGAFVTAADINGDGVADLIAGAGPGGGPRVVAYSGKALMSGSVPARMVDFFSGDTSSRGGSRVSAKDIDGDGVPELLVGDGATAGSSVRVYLASSLSRAMPGVDHVLAPFFTFTGGVFVG